MSYAVEVENLSKEYVKARSLRELILRPLRRAGRVTALSEASLEVRKGEIFGLLGPNGAGKTTLLKILTGLVAPSSGCARVAGFDVSHSHVAVRASVGFVTSEERSFYWRLSGRDNLHFFGRLCNVPSGRLAERCSELLGQMDLSEAADRRFSDYSSGMKQRLAVARALLHDPPVLIMDEPTRSLDPSAARNLREFVRDRLNGEQGKTILLATHNLDEAESLCHRLAILSKGKVRRAGTIEDIRAAESPRDRYRVEVKPAFRPVGAGYAVLHQEKARLGAILVTLETDRSGSGLTRFLREALDSGGTVVSCQRVEVPLQEVFEKVVGEERAAAAGITGGEE